MSCDHANEYNEHKTYSDNILKHVQGVYLPGDESVHYCKFDGGCCSASKQDNLDSCGYKETEYYCPDCFCNEYNRVYYLFDLHNGMTCLNCGKTFTKKEWLKTINESADDINSTILHQKNKINDLEKKIQKLEKELKEKQCEIAGYKYANEMLLKERKTA